jgi:hypothetical protein
LRRRATIARKAIIQILETAAEYGFAGEEWQMLAQDMTALTHALRGVKGIEVMELGVTILERRTTHADSYPVLGTRERIERQREIGVSVNVNKAGSENPPGPVDLA